MTHKSVLELIICHFALVVAACGPAAAEQPSLQVDTSRVLYDFDKPELANNWQIVNDGVMGGRSIGSNLKFLSKRRLKIKPASRRVII